MSGKQKLISIVFKLKLSVDVVKFEKSRKLIVQLKYVYFVKNSIPKYNMLANIYWCYINLKKTLNDNKCKVYYVQFNFMLCV